MANPQDDDEDILGRPEDAEELPPEIAAQLQPSVTGNPYAAMAAADSASKPQPKSIAGAPPAAPVPSMTDMPRRPLDNVPRGTMAMPPTGGPLDMPAPAMPGVSGGGTAGPNLSQDVLAGNVAPPYWRDYKPQHVGLGRKILAGALGGLAGMSDPKLGAETTRSIAYGPAVGQYEGDVAQYKGALEQGEQAGKQATAARAEKTAESEDALRSAQAENQTSEAKARDNPADKQDWSIVPDTNWEINKTTGETRQATGVPDRTKIEKPDTIEMGNGTFQWDGKAWNKIGPSKKTEGDTAAGTWSIQEDTNGKPILMNSKTGQTKPADGLEKSGTAEKIADKLVKGQEPIKAAQQYADDYLMNGRFTGPGDEALQEKFFELAKPSTGFRMTQPQIQMLANSRGWMGGAEAHLRHMTSGTWFSNEQRQQIVQTMKDLAQAKLASPANGQGSGAKTYTDAEVQAAAKAHNMTPDQIEQAYKAKGYTKAGASQPKEAP